LETLEFKNNKVKKSIKNIIKIASLFLFLLLLFLIKQPLPVYSDNKSPFIIPTEGNIVTDFRESYFDTEKDRYLKHTGIDIEGNFGQKVVASGNGVVTYSGFSPIGGRTLVIKHNERIRTTYLNLLQIYATAGSYVRQGEVIACIGALDDPSNQNYHLHFGIIYENRYIDPVDLLGIDYSSISRFIYLEYLPDDFNFSQKYKE
jgi:murein DD-endopeptidase MepM/ murein hydrolase activator NlpD